MITTAEQAFEKYKLRLSLAYEAGGMGTVKHWDDIVDKDRFIMAIEEVVKNISLKPDVIKSLWARFPKGVWGVDIEWNLKYHPSDLGQVMTANDIRFIGADAEECIDFILAHNVL